MVRQKSNLDLRGKKPIQRTHTIRKVESRTRSVSAIKKNRMQRRAATVLIVVLALIASITSFSYASYANRLLLKEMHVVGAKNVSSQEVQAAALGALYIHSNGFIAPENILLLSDKSVVEGITTSLPRVESVSVSRRGIFDQDITVTVKEREPFARVCNSLNACFLADESGFVFAASANERVLHQYVFHVGTTTSLIGTSLEAFSFSKMREVLFALFSAGYEPSDVFIGEEGDARVICSNFSLLVLRSDSPEIILRNLELALSSSVLRGALSTIDYIDIRFGNRIYFKKKGASGTPSSIDNE